MDYLFPAIAILYYILGLIVCFKLYSKNEAPYDNPRQMYHWKMIRFLAAIWPLCLIAYIIRTKQGKPWPPEKW